MISGLVAILLAFLFLPGCNALETSLLLGQSWTRNGKPYMLIDTVKRVLETLEKNQVPYAVIGGLAVSHHAVPRLTHDVDLIVPAEVMGQIRTLFAGCYQRGTAVVEVYDMDGTRVDFLPAKLRFEREALAKAVPGIIGNISARIVAVRDLLLLKMFAAGSRPVLGDRKQDEADITRLLEMNNASITAEDVRYIGDHMLELCFTPEDHAKTVTQVQWLNDTLAQLHMTERCYPLAQ